jgi:hypothetical protein
LTMIRWQALWLKQPSSVHGCHTALNGLQRAGFVEGPASLRNQKVGVRKSRYNLYAKMLRICLSRMLNGTPT